MVDFLATVGNGQGIPCYQTAAVRADAPDAPALFTGSPAASGSAVWSESFSITNKLLIRFGLACNNSSTTNLGQIDTLSWFSTQGCQRLLGTTQAVIQPGMMTAASEMNVFPIGTWVPTVGMAKIMAGIVVMNNENTDLENELVIRYANDRQAPNGPKWSQAWVACEAGYNAPAATNTARNTTKLSLPGSPGSYFWMQAGLAVRKKAGATNNPAAEIWVTAAASDV